MDKGSGVAVEVYTFFGVEEHILAGVYFQEEVFERAHTYDACHVLLFLFAHIVKFSGLVGCLASLAHHFCDEVVCVNHSTFAALHLTVGEFHHTVREVYEVLTPFEAQLVQEDGEHLEVVVLLVAHNVDHLVDGVVLKPELCSTDVLCHVHAGAVGAKQQFFVKAFVGQVGPYRAIFLLIEKAFFKSFEHFLAAFEVGVAFVVDFVEAYAERLVCFVEAGVYPFVHLAPEGSYLRVVVFPAYQHFVCLFDKGRFFLSLCFGSLFVEALGLILFAELLYFFAVVLVEGYVVVADEVVALLAGAFGGLSVAVLFPCEHRLADVDAAVVYDVGFHHAVTVGSGNL